MCADRQYTGPLPPLVQMFQDLWRSSKEQTQQEQEGGKEDLKPPDSKEVVELEEGTSEPPTTSITGRAYEQIWFGPYEQACAYGSGRD